MQAIMLCGLARSGKDTAADYIAEKHGFEKHTFSETLGAVLAERNVEPTKANLLRLGNELREKNGMATVAKLLDSNITGNRDLLLVGPRSIEEVQYFKKKYPNLLLVRVSSTAEKRFKRRSELDAQDKKKFFERDKADAKEKGLGEVIKTAKIEIRNDSTKKALYKKIDRLVTKIKIRAAGK